MGRAKKDGAGEPDKREDVLSRRARGRHLLEGAAPAHVERPLAPCFARRPQPEHTEGASAAHASRPPRASRAPSARACARALAHLPAAPRVPAHTARLSLHPRSPAASGARPSSSRAATPTKSRCESEETRERAERARRATTPLLSRPPLARVVQAYLDEQPPARASSAAAQAGARGASSARPAMDAVRRDEGRTRTRCASSTSAAALDPFSGGPTSPARCRSRRARRAPRAQGRDADAAATLVLRPCGAPGAASTRCSAARGGVAPMIRCGSADAPRSRLGDRDRCASRVPRAAPTRAASPA